MQFSKQGSADGIDQNLLILLHGLGDTAENFLKFGIKMNLPQTALLSIQGSIGIPFAGWAWTPSFDDQGNILPDNHPLVQKGLLESRSRVSTYIHSIGATWPKERIFLLGFGQGGSIALDLVLNADLNVGGVISLGGFPILYQPRLKNQIPIFTSRKSGKSVSFYCLQFFTLGIRMSRL